MVKNTVLFAAACLVTLGLLASLEFGVRRFADVNFLGSSSGGFTPARFGTSYGNTPGFEGESFGGRFVTDGEGFRIDPRFTPTAPAGAPALLMLGDSVLFGPAVADGETISGRLRRALPRHTIYNAAAVGYDTFDYRNVVRTLVPRKADITGVAVVDCLNDLLAISSQQIKAQVVRMPGDTVAGAQSLLRRANDYLRTRSKLYLLLRGMVRDAQLLYFEHDLQQYRDVMTVQRGLQPLRDIKEHLDRESIALTVFIAPFEAQLRPGAPEDFGLPQRQLTAYFRNHGIDAVDALPAFAAASGGNSRALFLYGDPMHLNAAGHAVMARLIGEHLPHLD